MKSLPFGVLMLLSLLVSAAVSFGITPIVKRVAYKVGAVDVPKDERRMHSVPIPRLGGLAIAIAFLLTVVLFAQVGEQMQGILLGAVVILVLGVLDDCLTLRAWFKFLVQIFAAYLVTSHGCTIRYFTNPIVTSSVQYLDLGRWSVPITIVWIVAITNAVNFIDGLDGLAVGVSAISEDRLKFACAENLSVRDNIMSIYLNSKAFTKGMLLDMKKVNQYVAQCIQDYEIKCDSPDDPVRLLSGGNIQKVVVAREFTCGSNLIIASQPTRGIDVGTSEMIRKTLIRKARQEDVATLLISSDLNEVLEVSDRLLVMYKGQFVAHFTKPSEVSEELLGEYMLGNRHMSEKEMGEYV